MIRSCYYILAICAFSANHGLAARTINFSADNTLGNTGGTIYGNLATVTVRNISSASAPSQTVSITGGVLDIGSNVIRSTWVGSCISNCTIVSGKFQLSASGVVHFLSDPATSPGGDMQAFGTLQVGETAGAVTASGMFVMISNSPSWIDRSLPIIINATKPF